MADLEVALAWAVASIGRGRHRQPGYQEVDRAMCRGRENF
jgi:hypothetical protein